MGKTKHVLVVIAALLVGCAKNKPAITTTAVEPAPYIYVGGEVRLPGRYGWTNGMTVKDGLQVAGGLTDFARRTLQLTHANGNTIVIRLNAERTVTNDIPLQAGDKLRSPRSFW